MLNTVVDVLNYVTNGLKTKCTGYLFVNSFPEKLTEFPISKPTVSVGISKADIPFSECTYLGTNTSKVKYYGAVADCSVALKICVPKSSSGIKCYQAFDSIANACLSLNGVDVVDLSCGNIVYDRIMGALVLSAEIRLKAELLNTIASST